MLSHSKQPNKDEGQNSGGRKTSSLRPPEQTLRCPRCDSPNTKFCYYNNYSLTQPRHFCKACRRYWTKGGALRNVPIGGSCRKNKKTKSCSSRFLLGESASKDSSSDMGGMKFYGLSAMDFQLGGLNNFPPRVTTTNQFSSSYGDTSSNPNSFVNLDPLGFNFPSHFVMKQGDHHHHQQQQQQQINQSGGGLASFHEMGTSNNNHLHHHHNNDLASSIESLSSINQDLHWKLQQQRLSMLFGGGGGEIDQQQQKKQDVLEPQVQRLQPILFQNLETSKPTQSSMDGDSRKDSSGGGGGLATEWFFDSSYAPANLNPNPNPNPATPTDSSTGNDQNGSINNWNGIQAWNHLNQYSSIP